MSRSNRGSHLSPFRRMDRDSWLAAAGNGGWRGRFAPFLTEGLGGCLTRQRVPGRPSPPRRKESNWPQPAKLGSTLQSIQARFGANNGADAPLVVFHRFFGRRNPAPRSGRRGLPGVQGFTLQFNRFGSELETSQRAVELLDFRRLV